MQPAATKLRLPDSKDEDGHATQVLMFRSQQTHFSLFKPFVHAAQAPVYNHVMQERRAKAQNGTPNSDFDAWPNAESPEVGIQKAWTSKVHCSVKTV